MEGARLRHVNGVHGLVRQTENLGSFETHYLAGQSLLRSGHFTSLDEELVLASVSQHVFELQVPGSRSYLSLLEKLFFRQDVVDKHGLEVIDNNNLLFVG